MKSIYKCSSAIVGISVPIRVSRVRSFIDLIADVILGYCVFVALYCFGIVTPLFLDEDFEHRSSFDSQIKLAFVTRETGIHCSPRC